MQTITYKIATALTAGTLSVAFVTFGCGAPPKGKQSPGGVKLEALAANMMSGLDKIGGELEHHYAHVEAVTTYEELQGHEADHNEQMNQLLDRGRELARAIDACLAATDGVQPQGSLAEGSAYLRELANRHHSRMSQVETYEETMDLEQQYQMEAFDVLEQMVSQIEMLVREGHSIRCGNADPAIATRSS